MPAQMQLALVCQPVPGGTATPPCGTLDGVPYAPGVINQATLSADTVALLEAAALPVDWEQVGGFFGFAILPILGLYVSAWCVGLVVKLVGSS